MDGGLAAKIGRLVVGGIGEFVDQLEGEARGDDLTPRIEASDATLVEVRGALGAEIARRHRAEERCRELEGRLAVLASELEAMLAGGRDAAAERVISEQLDLEDRRPVLVEARDAAVERVRALEAYLASLEARRAKLEAERLARAEDLAAAKIGVDLAEADFQRRLDRLAGEARRDRVAARLAEAKARREPGEGEKGA